MDEPIPLYEVSGSSGGLSERGSGREERGGVIKEGKTKDKQQLSGKGRKGGSGTSAE